MQGVSFFKDARGHRIAYAIEGQGPMLVLPAWWVSHLEKDAGEPAFRRFIAGLAEHFRVVRYDRLGVGMSDRVPATFGLDREVEQLEALIAHLRVPRVHLLGFSCGGTTAVAFAARHRQRSGNWFSMAATSMAAKFRPRKSCALSSRLCELIGDWDRTR